MRERSRAREWALRALYAWEARGGGGAGLEEVATEFLTRRLIAPGRRPYFRRILDAVATEEARLDAELQECLTNWRLERLSSIDRNILRIAAAEMLEFDDIPPRVSIQEAVRLAEKYGTDRSPAFVNGVLDALMRRVRS
jgi:transcription antitermination protein NusB